MDACLSEFFVIWNLSTYFFTVTVLHHSLAMYKTSLNVLQKLLLVAGDIFLRLQNLFVSKQPLEHLSQLNEHCRYLEVWTENKINEAMVIVISTYQKQFKMSSIVSNFPISWSRRFDRICIKGCFNIFDMRQCANKCLNIH